MLGIKYDKFSHTSDHFDLIQDLCTKMLKEGKAYVDNTNPEQMKKEREERKESVNRSNSKDESQDTICTEKNLSVCDLVYFKLIELYLELYHKFYSCTQSKFRKMSNPN